MTRNAKIAIAAIVVVLIAVLIAVASCSGCSNKAEPPASDNGTKVTAVYKDAGTASSGSDGKASGSEEQGQQGQASSGAAEATTPGSNGEGGSSGAGGETPSDGSEPEPPAHQHTWATRTIDDGDVWVVDQAAWDEQVAAGEHIHCSCGMDFYDTSSYVAHQKNAMCSYTVVTDYSWVHHDEVGHYEHRFHTETYCTSCGAIA